MKNKLVLIGLRLSGVSTLLGITGTYILSENKFHLISVAIYIGLFSIMSFVASKLYKD